MVCVMGINHKIRTILPILLVPFLVSSCTKINERFRSSESVERAILEEKKCQFLYFSNEKFFFMDNLNYEQIEIGKDIINEEQTKLLIENDEVIIQFHENNPLSLRNVVDYQLLSPIFLQLEYCPYYLIDIYSLDLLNG